MDLFCHTNQQQHTSHTAGLPRVIITHHGFSNICFDGGDTKHQNLGRQQLLIYARPCVFVPSNSPVRTTFRSKFCFHFHQRLWILVNAANCTSRGCQGCDLSTCFHASWLALVLQIVRPCSDSFSFPISTLNSDTRNSAQRNYGCFAKIRF